MINQINGYKSVSFGSIKPAIRVGEEVIREFKAEYPKVKSPSKLGLRILNVSNSLAKKVFADEFDREILNINSFSKKRLKTKKLPDSLVKEPFLQALMSTFKDERILEKLRHKLIYSSPDNFIATAKPLVKKYKVANCGEMYKI